MPSYEETRHMLTHVLYMRGIVLDPYTIMEAATLIHQYLVEGSESYVVGAHELLQHILSKMGFENPEVLARTVIREVIERLQKG